MAKRCSFPKRQAWAATIGKKQRDAEDEAQIEEGIAEPARRRSRGATEHPDSRQGLGHGARREPGRRRGLADALVADLGAAVVLLALV